MYERPFVLWAERAGFTVAFLTQMDLHHAGVADGNRRSAAWALIASLKCLVFIGHCEYWSWEMRDAVDTFLDSGGKVFRGAGNFWWQIRLEDGDDDTADPAVQVCYKCAVPLATNTAAVIATPARDGALTRVLRSP